MESQYNSTQNTSLTDKVLFEAIKKGESSALSVLFNRYGRLVYGLALKILKNSQEAEDLTQEIFLALWRNASKYPDCRYFLSYLITMTRSRAIDKIRSQNRQTKLFERWGQMIIPDKLSSNPVEQASFVERAERVRHALAQLPEKQRLVIEMAYDTGLSQSEIAQQLELPLGTVKSCTRQGLLKLKQILLKSGSLAHE